MYEYKAKLVAVKDGDTVVLDVDVGFHITVRETFRLARLNCPPAVSFEGVRAKAFTLATLSDAVAIKVQTARAEKYGRWLAEIYYLKPDDPKTFRHLNALLLASGNAVRYRP